VVGRERDVRREGLPHGLAVLPALGDGEIHHVLVDRGTSVKTSPVAGVGFGE
jgi:hypothetical protein